MISYSIIQKSQLEGALRLDAEYYQPEYLDIEKKLAVIKTEFLENIAESVLSFGAYSLTNNIEWQDSGVPYLNVGDIHEGYIDYSDVKYISEKVDKILQKSQIKEGEIVLTMAGTIGNAAVVHNIPNDHINGNQAIAKIKLKKNFSPYYLAAFLNSRYGQLQTWREIVSSVQANIFLGQIKKLRVPIFDDEKTKIIESLYLNFLEELENSKSLYSQAEDLLLEELGLKNFENEESLFSVVNLSEVKNANRIDAEYFQDKYKKMIEIVKEKGEVKNLGDLLDFSRGIFISTDYYVEEKTPTPYIRIKELSEKGGINKSEIIYINEKYEGDEKNKLKENDLVVAIIGDTIGKTNKIDKELSGGYCSNNTGRLRIKKEWENKMLPECNELIFQSVLVQSQIEKKKAQTGQPKINDGEIRTIIIPILPKPTQQKIADLVQKSHEARKKAKELLGEAKQKVEKLIEK